MSIITMGLGTWALEVLLTNFSDMEDLNLGLDLDGMDDLVTDVDLVQLEPTLELEAITLSTEIESIDYLIAEIDANQLEPCIGI